MKDSASESLIRSVHKEFYRDRLGFEALEQCLNEGYTPLYAPSIVLKKIEEGKDSQMWHNYYTTPSVLITTKTKGGKGVVIIAHVLTSSCKPERLRTDLKRGLFDGAFIVEKEECFSLLEREDKENVYVLNFSKYCHSGFGFMKVKKAQTDIKIEPFFGTSKGLIDEYFHIYSTLFGDAFEINHYPIDEPKDDFGLARYIYIGNKEKGTRGIGARESHYDSANFLGAKPELQRKTIEDVYTIDEETFNGLQQARPFKYNGIEFVPIDYVLKAVKDSIGKK